MECRLVSLDSWSPGSVFFLLRPLVLPSERTRSKSFTSSFEVWDLTADREWTAWRRFQEKDVPRYSEENELLRARGAVDDCACRLIPELCAEHARYSLLAAWVRCRDWREEAIRKLAELRGWSTLHGPHGRRRELEAVLEEELQVPPETPGGRGAPRQIFLGSRHAQKAETFLNHAVETGTDHVRETVGAYTVADMEGGDVWVPPVWVRFPDASFAAGVLEAVGAACGETRRRYKYRRRSLANRILAEIADCDPRAIRYAREKAKEPEHELWKEALCANRMIAAVRREAFRDHDPEAYREEELRYETLQEIIRIMERPLEEQKEWLSGHLPHIATRGELLHKWIRPRQKRNGLTEPEAVWQILEEKLLPRLIPRPDTKPEDEEQRVDVDWSDGF